MTKKERYQHYTINELTGEKQWYFPMELEFGDYEKDTDEYESKQEYYQNLKNQTVKLNNGQVLPCEIGMTKLGFREFEALHIPVNSHEEYLDLIKDEMKKQDEMKLDGRCTIPATIGGIKLCPRKIPNPNYVEGGKESKTIMNSCVGCIYESKKHEHTVTTFSALGSVDEDGDFAEYEPSNPHGYNSADSYDKLRAAFVEYVKANKPKLTELAELLSAEYLQIEAANALGKSRKTINSQVDILKKLVLEFLDNTVL